MGRVGSSRFGGKASDRQGPGGVHDPDDPWGVGLVGDDSESDADPGPVIVGDDLVEDDLVEDDLVEDDLVEDDLVEDGLDGDADQRVEAEPGPSRFTHPGGKDVTMGSLLMFALLVAASYGFGGWLLQMGYESTVDAYSSVETETGSVIDKERRTRTRGTDSSSRREPYYLVRFSSTSGDGFSFDFSESEGSRIRVGQRVTLERAESGRVVSVEGSNFEKSRRGGWGLVIGIFGLVFGALFIWIGTSVWWPLIGQWRDRHKAD